MPLRPARRARRGVVGAPVARTAAVVGTAAGVTHGVNRRQDRRDDRPIDVLDEPEFDRPRDRFAPAGHGQLAIDRHGVGLDRVA